MPSLSSLPCYTDIANVLADAHVNLDPAQTHGLLCGYISATSGKADKRWAKSILGKNKNQACLEFLQQLYEMSYHQMSEFSFEFSLILPDDEVDINVRTEALGLWCQGFLAGLEQCEVPTQNREESDLTETLDDLIEIAQVNFGDIADSEEDETAYFELVEYVRLGVLMVFQDLKAGDQEQAPDENNMLH